MKNDPNICGNCDGNGVIEVNPGEENQCSLCDGTGIVEEAEDVSLGNG